MKPSDQELVTRFVDGELKGKELAIFEQRLEIEPDLRGTIEGMTSIGEGIRGLFADADVVGHDMRMAATSLGSIEIPKADEFTAGVVGKIGAENPEA